MPKRNTAMHTSKIEHIQDQVLVLLVFDIYELRATFFFSQSCARYFMNIGVVKCMCTWFEAIQNSIWQ